MQHLIHERHHPHLRKRAMLEFAGFFGLVGLLISQDVIIIEAIETVSEVSVLWFVLLLSCYWLLLPLTAVSYKLITPKPKRLRLSTTILAHLAGAGPGRIIPGGIGNLSISSIHLKKSGISIEQAIGVIVTNNLFGVFANTILVIGAVLIEPSVISVITDNVSSEELMLLLGLLIGLVVLLQWLFHARGTKKELQKVSKQWRKIALSFIHQPKKAAGVLFIALTIAGIHAFMLDFSAFALGIQLSLTDALLALSLGVAIGGIFPTPGGIGGVEAGIIATLVVLGYGGSEATSIAVLFRVATYWQPLIPGTLAYLYLRERKLL